MLKTAQDFVQAARAGIREAACAEVAAGLPDARKLIIDVREPEEYRQGHLPAAINIPRGLLEFRISGEPALQDCARPLVVYCKTSGRAALAASVLQQMGFSDVTSIAGGYDAWAAAGLPVAQPAPIAFG